MNRRVFLVFGAVDYQAKVWVNDALVAEHEGGYTPFEAEITALVKPGQTAKVTVRAYDVTDAETPTGKQTGWYTRTCGIWQTPYLEYRGLSYVRKARITPDIDKEQATFDCEIEAHDAGTYTLDVHAVLGSRHLTAKQSVPCRPGANKVQVVLPVHAPALWSPDSPSLYETRITLNRGNAVVDEVDTYFGMRKVGHGVYGDAGHEYILLNNKPIYLRGALHQSFNPKGVYTHPDDEFIRNDYAKAKEFGLNFLRLHIKMDEPRALYWADRLGVLLMCDMPNFNKNTPLSHKRWENMLRAAIDRDYNHPAIFAWCDFNETWGIRDGGYTPEVQQWVRDMYRLTKELDPTRLAEDNSPCTYDHTETDINSWHFYIDRYEAAAKHIANVVEQPVPGSEFNYAKGWKQGTAPLINSEYGGVGAGSGDRDVSWVFLFLTNLLRKYDKIGGYIYTELEDIEWEHNGFMNYDRSPKEFAYPAGITLAQLQSDEFPVLDCPPYQRIDAHSPVRIPV
ncbi:MAG: glycoside hydrolase family 2, partial [Candidatus Hydrogenedentes bacterium]|nr:glycoside hydrolase family 2 [Candidatus Hydrogenedentota bacterium]